MRVGATMTDKHQAVDPQQRSRADLPWIEHPLDVVEGGFRQQSADFGAQATHQFLTQDVGNQLGDCLARLEQDVAGETIGNGNVGLSAEKFLALQVPDEIQLTGLQERVSFLYELVAFASFFAVREQAEARGVK